MLIQHWVHVQQYQEPVKPGMAEGKLQAEFTETLILKQKKAGSFLTLPSG